jgi:NADH-quinone oxidoreductase subunit G
VRFGQEIAGVMELGMAGRGEHSEIMPFVARTVDSELSGNMIDVCPVGALTSKPFRFTARTWELTRRKSVSPHDSLGSNLMVQVKGNRVLRVLPLENEAINECWISDKDRFSYEALNVETRLVRPLLRRDGRWEQVEWAQALEHVAARLKSIAASHGATSIGALASPHQTVEELHLLAKGLLEHETLSGDEIKQIIKGEPIVRNRPDEPVPARGSVPSAGHGNSPRPSTGPWGGQPAPGT